MAEMIKVNKKVINDPMYTPVRQWLSRRIAQLEIDGDPDELALAKERYDSLVAGDLVIEDVKTFADGIQRVCIVSRKTGFARVDIEFTRVPMQDILNDFGIPFVNIEDIDALKAFSKTNDAPAVLLWLEYKDTYGVLLTQDAATTIDGPMEAFGDLFFNQYQTERESLDWIDYDTIESGTVTVTDPSIGAGIYPLFIQELVLNEANLPIITSNLPEFITTSRGQDFSIPNTYWFGGTLDITQTATVEITTGAGYTIPVRSDDKLFITGDTIFGSSEKPVTDQIIVRVTHMYNGRPVRRTFRIEVRIDKDTAFDLTFEVHPDTIKAARGDEVQVTVYGFFKGQPVVIQSPPSLFESPKKYGDLTYVETQEDGGMIYSGKITGVPPLGLETDKDLYLATFNHVDGSTPYEAPAYINFELVRAESKPVFAIKGLTTTLRGYLEDQKQMEVKAFYGDTPVPAYELGIQPGARGDLYQLIRIDGVTEDAVNYTVIHDSQKPGEDITDSFEQKFTYLAPDGVKHTLFRTINIIISKVSIVEVIPYKDPRDVTRYQKGGPLFKVMINDEDKTSQAIGLNMTWAAEDDQFVAWEGDQWLIKYSIGEVKEVPVKFTWKQPYDGANHDMSYEGTLRIKVWDPNTNPGGDGNGENPGGGGGDQGGNGNSDDGAVNTEVVVFPMYWGIDGLSDERGTVSFRVYSDGKEITKTAVQDTARKVMPAEIRDEGVRYDAGTGMLVWTYYKLAECNAKEAKLFFTDPKDGNQANLPANRRGRMYITANVKQSRVLRVIEQDTSDPVWLDETGRAKLSLSFAGEPISLLDLNRTIVPPANNLTKQVREVEVGADFIDFTYTTLQGPNSNHSAPMEYEFSYTDPVTGDLQKLKVVLNMLIKIPPLKIEQFDGGIIDTRMWETGSLNFQATIGKRDVTNLMSYDGSSPTNRYVRFSGRNWTIINADKTPHTESINVRLLYTINVDYTQLSAYVPKTFNIDAWDGITFRHTLEPTDIVGDSGDEGEISGTFTYKYDNVTNGIRLDRTRSVIPDNITVDNPVWDPVSEKAVIKYRLKRGYKYPMTLVFMHPTQSDSVSVPMTVDVKWAPGLNLESTQTTLSGYHTDVLDFALKYNYSGTPVTNDKLAITYTAAPTGSTSLVEKQADKLRVSLDQGGLQGTTYDCQFTVHAEYVDPDTQVSYGNELIVPTEIKVPTVAVGSNPSTSVKVYDRGQFRIKLVDSRGKDIPITLYTPNGTNNYIAFVSPNSYYVVKGDQTQSILTDFPLTLSYEIGGNAYTIDAEVNFQILQFDGIDFVGTAVQTKLEGKAGSQAVAEFVFKYKGDITHAVSLDPSSVIPPNLLIGQLSNSQLPYTLKGQGQDTARFRFNRNGAAQTPVEGKDFVNIVLPVISTSSDEAFTLVSNDDEIELDWMKTGTLPVSVKYGDYILKGDAPGLSYKVTATGDQGVVVAGKDADGVILKADLASVPGTKKSYLDEIEISYDVGGATPKTLKIQFNTRITTPVPVITANDIPTLAIYDRSTFAQSLNFNQDTTGALIYPTSRVKIVPQTVPNQYVEMYNAFSFEVIGARPVTANVIVPLELTYTLKGVAEPQTFKFDATLNIIGHTQPRFYCQYTPPVLEGVLNETRDIRFRPLYKDLPISTAVLRQDLSTMPSQVSIVEVKKDPNNAEWTIVTLSGDDDGVGQCKFIWEYQEGAGEISPELLTWEGNIQVRIMGEPGIEIGDRDNLIEGKHNDTGTYKLEILFGGLPLNTNAEIARGLLTLKVKPYSSADRNAQVMTITGTGADTFDYKLAGPLWVGQRAETKEILQLSYKFGGQTYTREIEIPMGYTTSDIVASGKDTYPVLLTDMFVDKDITTLNFLCDGLDLASTWMNTGIVSQNGVKSKYIVYTGRKYRADWAELTATNTVVSTTFGSTYRGYPWTVNHDITFQLPAWDQKTYKVNINGEPTTLSVFVGETLNVLVSEKFRAGNVGPAGDNFNAEESDLGNIATLEYTNSTSGSFRIFALKGMVPGTHNSTMWFDRFINLDTFPYKDPKELYYDYYTRPVIIDVKVRPLTLSAPSAISAGNDDVKPSGTITVRLNTLNIPVNDPNLVITALDPDVLTIESKTANSMTYRCKLPLNTAINSKFTANFKYAYTDPGTGLTHEGTQAVPVTYVNPADYPVVSGLIGGGTGNPMRLWKKYGQLFKVTSAGADITSQITDFGDHPDKGNKYCEVLKPFAPANPDWVQCVRGTDNIGAIFSWQYWSFKVPFRGTTVTLEYGIEWYFSGIPANPAQLVGTYTPSPIFLKDGAKGAAQFNLTYRGEKTVLPVMNNALSDLKGVMTVDSVDVDNTALTLTTNYTVLKEETNTLVFCWDLPGFDSYTDNMNRLKMNVAVIPNVRIVLPDTPPDWEIYQNYPAPFTLMSGNNNIMDGVTASATVPDAWVRNKTLTSTTGPVYQCIDANKEDTLKTLKFKVTLTKGVFAGQALEVEAPVNFKAWDQTQFRATVPLDTFPVADDGLPIISIGRGLKIDLAMSSSARTPDSPTWGNPGGLITAYSELDVGLTNTYNIVKATKGTSNTAQFTASIAGVTNGYVKGKLAVDYKGSNTSLPNGYPPGTEGKNRQTFDVYYEVFEPELTWVGEQEPDEVSIDAAAAAGRTGWVERQLKFGRTLINYRNCTITMRASDQSKVVMGTPAVNYDIHRFFLANVYVNRYQDLHVEVQISVSTKIGTTTYTKVYMQKVNLLGAGATIPVLTLDNPHAVDAKVWERGPLPFDIALDSSATLPSGWKVSAVAISNSANVKMASGNAALTTWVVYDGDKTKPITSDPTFTVTLSDGGYELTKAVTARFNIEQYDGVELKAVVRDSALTKRDWYLPGFFALGNGASINVTWDLYFQGEAAPAGQYNTIAPTTDVFKINGSTNNAGVMITRIDASTGTAYHQKPEMFKFRIYKVGAPSNGTTEGVDFVLVDTPVLGYSNSLCYMISHDDEVTGKFGDVLTINALIRGGINQIPWIANQGIISGYNPAVITTNNNNDLKDTYVNARFVQEIAVEKVVSDVVVSARHASYPGSTTTFNLKVTQVSPVEKPTIEDVQSPNVVVSQKGKVPFTVMHNGADVTNDLTNIVVTGGKYVKQTTGTTGTDDVWEVIKSEVAGVTAPVKFTFDITVEGVKFSFEQSANFVIAPFNDAILDIRPAAASTTVGIGKPGSMKFTGSWGTSPLAGNVVLDLDKSELGSLITVNGTTPNGDGSITVNYTGGAELEEGEVTFHFKTVDGNPTPVEGYDWVDVKVNVSVMLTSLEKVEPFETEGRGTVYAPVVLEQQVSYNGVALDNDDADMKISMSSGAKVGIHDKTANSITYRFLVKQATEVTHRLSVTFEYKGVAILTVPLQLTQEIAAADPVVSEPELLTVENDNYYKVPFTILSGIDGRDITSTLKIKSILFDGKSQYFNIDEDSDTFGVVYFDKTQLDGTAKYEVTVVDGTGEVTVVVDGPMRILPNLKTTGLVADIVVPEAGRGVVVKGQNNVVRAKIKRNGEYVANTLIEVDPTGTGYVRVGEYQNFNRDPDGFTINIVLRTTTDASVSGPWPVPVKFNYIPDKDKTQEAGVTYVIRNFGLYPVGATELVFMWEEGVDYNNIAMGLGDNYEVKPIVYYGATKLKVNQCSWSIANPGEGFNNAVNLTSANETTLFMKGDVVTTAWAGAYIKATYQGVSKLDWKSFNVFPGKTTVTPKQESEPAPNKTTDFMFSTPTPVLPWNGKQGYTLGDGPRWTSDKTNLLSGRFEFTDPVKNVTTTTDLVDATPDNVGRYHVPVTMTHIPMTVKLLSAVVRGNAKEKPTVNRATAPVANTEWKLLGAPVLATIDDNEFNTSTDKTTTITFRLAQSRSTGLYRFAEQFTFNTVEGPGVYVDNGISDAATNTQFIQMKGTGEKGDVAVKGTVTDSDGYTYPVTLKLKAADPSQVEFILVDDTVEAFEQQTVDIAASATYQGANLPLNHSAVTITSDPSEWIEIVSVSADEIKVKVIKDVTADETFTSDIILTAYGEVHKQELTVNLKTAVPPLDISGMTTIIGGNLDTGSAPLVINHNGNNVPVNNSKLTFTVASDFTITEFKESSFLYEITTPLGEKGAKTVNVKVEYEVSPGVIAKGEFDQPMTITDPADYPRITSNPTWALDPYIYKMSPPTVVVMSGTTNISQLCIPTNLTPNAWVILPPEEEQVPGEWFWVIDGPVSGQAGTKSIQYKVKAPFRDTFVYIDVTQNVYWALYPSLRDTWVITYSPNPVAIAPGETGEIEFDVSWAGRKTTDLTVTSPTSIVGMTFGAAVARDGKVVVPYTQTASSAVYVGNAVFTLNKVNTGTSTTYVSKAQTVTFKAKNKIVLTFTGTKEFTGGFGGPAINVPYTCTNNGKTFALITAGVTITTVPADVLTYGGVSAGMMRFSYNKKVDQETLDNVQVFVNFEGDQSNAETLAITTKPTFYVETIPQNTLTWSNEPANLRKEVIVKAWYGTKRVPNDSPDISFTHPKMTIRGAVGDAVIVGQTGTTSSTTNKFNVVYAPTATTVIHPIDIVLSSLTGTVTVAGSSLVDAQANETKQLQFAVKVGGTAQAEIENLKGLKLAKVPDAGNAVLTKTDFAFIDGTTKKVFGSNVTTGYTGTGTRLYGVVKFLASSGYAGWYDVDNTFTNVAQAPVIGATEKQEYNPDLMSVVVKFKLEQMQGASKVAIPTGTFGEVVTGGEIASVGPITASGDTNFPYSIDVTMTGNVGVGTLKGIIRVNGLDQNYSVNITFNTPQLKLTTTVGGSSATAVEISTRSVAKLPLTLMYGDQLLSNNDPNVKWTITFGSISLALRRQFVDQTNFWVAGITQSVGVVGSNNITAELIDQPGKKVTLPVFVKFVALPTPDWTSKFWTTSLPAKNAETKWIGTIGVGAGSGSGLTDTNPHFVEVITPEGSQRPVLNVPSNQAPNDPSGNRNRYIAMTTGWTGGAVTLQGVINVENVWWSIEATQITIPQEPLTVTDITNEVGNDPVEVFFDLKQVRGINGGPIVDINAINGVTFKTITFNSAIVQSVANVKQNLGANFSMVVTRKAGDMTNGIVPISMVVTVEGVDYLTVVNTTFTVPTPLVGNDGFETTGRGNQDNPVTLNQSVYLPN